MPMSPAVLVVEDDPSTQGLLVAVVKRLGLGVKTADDGGEALSIIAAEAPAAMILDLIMPEVDGFEVLRQLRWSAPQLLGKTIVVTAAALRDVDKCPELELVWKFLRKPLDIEQLGASLLDCVGSPSKKAGRGGVYEMPPRP